MWRDSAAWKIVKAWRWISENRKPSNAPSLEVTYLLIPGSIKPSHEYIIISSKLQSICRARVPALLIRSEDAASHVPFGAIIRRPDHSGQQGLFWGSILRRFIFPLFYSTNVPCHLDDLDASININFFGLFAIVLSRSSWRLGLPIKVSPWDLSQMKNMSIDTVIERHHAVIDVSASPFQNPRRKIDKLECENAGLRELLSDNASVELSFVNEISGNSTIANGNKAVRDWTPFAWHLAFLRMHADFFKMILPPFPFLGFILSSVPNCKFKKWIWQIELVLLK